MTETSAPGTGSAAEEAELRAALIAALAWQLEAGIDETIGESPLDRTGELPDAAFRLTAPSAPAAGAGPGVGVGVGVGAREGAAQRGAPAGKAAPAAAPPPDAATPDAVIEDARRAAGAAADLPSLAAALAAFEGSSLRAGAKNCVFADGRPGALVMVIGEGPGAEEDRSGKPFVGRSGQLLDRMLGAIGLDRAAEDLKRAVYITNLTPWRPLGNRAPADQEVTALAPFLERHIELAAPKLLLCLGGAPAKHVMGATVGVTRYRGTWIEYRRGARSIPCLATFHPAYLLRSPEMKRLAWRDLLALRERLDEILSA
ncbi:MAG: uracil-DNA glycosylase [Pseudomonadota bacterium]